MRRLPSVVASCAGLAALASVTIHTQAGLIAFMPTNGAPGPLNPANGVNGAVDIFTAADVPAQSGDGAGTLAGQTLAMALSVKLSDLGVKPAGLGSLGLTSLCTCDANGGTPSPITISQCLIDNNVLTVNDLLLLADQALAGVSFLQLGLDPCVTNSVINDALDALNKGLDACRNVCSCTP